MKWRAGALAIALAIVGLALLAWRMLHAPEDDEARGEAYRPDLGETQTENPHRAQPIIPQRFEPPAEGAGPRDVAATGDEEVPLGLRVVDDAGRPVIGARVGVINHRWRRDWGPAVLRRAWRAQGHAWRRSDERGVVDLSGLHGAIDLIGLEGEAAGWIGLQAARREERTVLELRRPQTVEVTVQRGGRPLVGISVELTAPRRAIPGEIPPPAHPATLPPGMARHQGSTWPDPSRTKVTDARGVARFELHPLDVGLGRRETLIARIEETAVPPVKIPRTAARVLEACIELSPSRPVYEFRIVDPKGRPRAIAWPLALRARVKDELGEAEVEMEPASETSDEDAADSSENAFWMFFHLETVGGRASWVAPSGMVAFRVFADLGLAPADLGEPSRPWPKDPKERARWTRRARLRGFYDPGADSRISVSAWDEDEDFDDGMFKGPWCPEEAVTAGVRSLEGRRPGPRVIDVVCAAPPLVTIPLRDSEGRPLPSGHILISDGDGTTDYPLGRDSTLTCAAGVARRFTISCELQSARHFGSREFVLDAVERDTILAPVRLPPPWCLVHGMVVDERDRPISGASVKACSEQGEHEAWTDEAGRYRISFPQAIAGEVVVTARKGISAARKQHVVQAGEAAPDLVLPSVGGLAVSVSYPRGAPRVRIRLEHQERGVIEGPFGAWRPQGPKLDTILNPLPPGLFEVHIAQEGVAPLIVRDVLVRKYDVTRDPRLSGIDLEPHLDTFEVEVRRWDGSAAVGTLALLHAWFESQGDTRTVWTRVDAHGRARFEVAPHQDSLLTIEDPRCGHHLASRPEHGQRIVLPRPCQVRLLTPAHLKPAEFIMVRLVPALASTRFPRPTRRAEVPCTDVPEQAKPAPLQPGRYEVTLQHRHEGGGYSHVGILGHLTVPEATEAVLVIPHDKKALPRIRPVREVR